MFRLLCNLSPFLAPADSGGGGEVAPDVETTFEMLKDDEEVIDLEQKVPPKTEEKEEKEEEDTETDTEFDEAEAELKELEEELKVEVPKEDELELITPVRRKEILAKYPNLYKDFPYLERSYYREQEFTNLYPTIKDAKEAADKASVLDRFEQDLTKGDISKVLKAVKETDQENFNQLVDNYLPTLARTDKDAYLHVIGNVVKETIQQMVTESRSSSDRELFEAAKILNKFIFGKTTYEPPTRLSKGDVQDPRENELSRREREFQERQHATASNELVTRVNNQIKATIENHLDPKNNLSDYVRGKASEDALRNITELIDKDARFQSLVGKLWQNAAQSGFSSESVSKVRSAYMTKAKTLLPAVIKQARIIALRGMGKRVREESNESPEPKAPSARNTGNSAAPRSSGNINFRGDPRKEAKKIPAGMSTKDFLMSD